MNSIARYAASTLGAAPTTATDDARPASDKPVSGRLTPVRMHVAAAVLHLTVYIGLALAYRWMKALRVFSAVLTMPTFDVATLSVVPRQVGTLNVTSFVSVFPLLTALCHILVATAPATVDGWLNGGFQMLRWLEYAVTSSVMLVGITCVVGVGDITVLAVLAAANAASMLAGLVSERVESARARWFAYVVSWILHAAAWLPAVAVFASAPIADLPDFVIAIFVTLVACFASFPLVFTVHLITRRARPVAVERAYIVLSFVAKTILVILVGFAALRLDSAFVDAAPEPSSPVSVWLVGALAASLVAVTMQFVGLDVAERFSGATSVLRRARPRIWRALVALHVLGGIGGTATLLVLPALYLHDGIVGTPWLVSAYAVFAIVDTAMANIDGQIDRDNAMSQRARRLAHIGHVCSTCLAVVFAAGSIGYSAHVAPLTLLGTLPAAALLWAQQVLVWAASSATRWALASGAQFDSL